MMNKLCGLVLLAMVAAGCGVGQQPEASDVPVPSVNGTVEPVEEHEPEGDIGDGGDGTKDVEFSSPQVDGDLEVFFLDVGQGDSTLFVHEDAVLMVDAGRHDRTDVVDYLHGAGVDHIDVLVGTHPHADHIGQFDTILETFTVTEVWMPGTVTTSQTFERVVSAIEDADVVYEEPSANQQTVVGPFVIDVIGPDEDANFNDVHDASLALRVTYGDVRFLFTGDAEQAAERRMVDRHGSLLEAEIYQVGHHGSTTSSTANFLEAVGGEVAIYSAGANNQYGHPHDEVVDRLFGYGFDVYGTDVHGTVKVVTDGVTYSVETESDGEVTFQSAPEVADEPEPVENDPPAVAEPSEGCVDLNTASFEDLQAIVHIGDARAQQVVEGRPWTSVESLTRLDGMAEGRLSDIVSEGVACVS